MTFLQLFLGATLLITLFSGVRSHSYVTSPQSRSNQKETQSGCRGPACLGPCDVSLSARSASAAVSTAKRGDTITIQWPRNNHAGGFIRFAWALTSTSDIHSSFDNHVQQINCHEVGGCKPGNAADPNGGDSGAGDGSVGACTQTLTVPADLTDGKWTLQWAWFGGAFSLGDYYSCIDYNIAGGVSGSTPAPVFIGGDYTYPNQQKCKFFNTDKLHVCTEEPCNAPIYPISQEQSGPPAFVQQGTPIISAPSSTPAPAPTPSSTTAKLVAPIPSTTGLKAPSTTGKVKASSTTGRKTQSQSTTGRTVKPAPSPSPVPSPAPTPVPSSAPSSSSSSCTTVGNMECLSSQSFHTCSPGVSGSVWSVAQSCASGTSCHPSGGYIYCY